MAGIYIHVPFCHSKCIYCDFYSIGRRNGTGCVESSEFVKCVANEYAQRKNELTEPIKTVYVGGGTPSSIDRKALRRLLVLFSGMPTIEEFTVEVNPEDVDDDLCHLLADEGVNRVSMGIQSFKDSILVALGRRHTGRQAIEAVERFRNAGICNISGDLIFGLPGDTQQGWETSLDRMLALQLPHISAYLLSYEPGTRITVMRDSGKIGESSEDMVNSMYALLTARAHDAGYQHYEISSYCKPGMASRHNSAYWNGTPYLGLGPGAHSYDGFNRRFNPPSLKQYMDKKGIGFAVMEDMTEIDRINDIIITAMRTAKGLNVDADSRLPGWCVENIMKAAEPHIKSGRLKIDSAGCLIIPERYLLISDSILVDLIQS